ncbi:MAG: PKD domain-containing protein [Candidatus Peribacteria bacterium]|nr:PKD domain-containing protein [Candidatus Peribacteria bacterium]
MDFSSAGSEGQIVNYRWDFGDGFISTEANPTHSFSAP